MAMMTELGIEVSDRFDAMRMVFKIILQKNICSSKFLPGKSSRAWRARAVRLRFSL